ncbi:MAG TPA: DEAD/DEAH box helicase, partial [Planctomycetota bacterium]|nr:DEAD/DEAH box helicase [Planctomycetota bacterium]
MSAATLLAKPVFLTLITTEPGGEGSIVRICAEKEDASAPGGIQTLERLIRAPRLTLAQSRMTGITNAQLDDAPDLDIVLQELLEFSAGAEAWIVPDANAARAALREASVSAGYPGRIGPTLIGMDELWAIVRPTERSTGVSPVQLDVAPKAAPGISDRFPIQDFQPNLRYGAHLPHLTLKDSTYFVTFRLADSVPTALLETWKAEREIALRNPDRVLSVKAQAELDDLFSQRIDQHLDNGTGKCWMKDPAVAAVVEDALKHFDGERYILLAWSVMPNHVHAVFQPLGQNSLSEILHSWKSYSSKAANDLLKREGKFWQEEYYDHLIRDDADYQQCLEYTYYNPEKSGLDNWKWRGAVFADRAKGTASSQQRHGRDAHATGLAASAMAQFRALETDLLSLPLPLLAEMNWLLSKTEHPLKKILKKAEGIAVKEQFTEDFSSGRVSLDKLFQDFSRIIDRLAPEEEGATEEAVTFTGEPVTSEEVGKLLGPHGPLAKALKGYEERPEQVEMAQRVAESLSTGKHLLAEAGTGVGKSLAYLIPAILFAKRASRPVVVATHTKNLQSQLFNKDIPFLKAHLGVDFDAALLKGRPNYLCLRKFMYTLQEASHELDDEERAQMLPIMTWATQTEEGDISEMSAFAPEKNPELWDRLHTVGDDCLKRQCPFYKRCFVYKARGLTRGADLVVLNHAMVFADLNLESGTLPKYSEIVFDEAHKLEDIATDHLASEITPKRIYKILNRLFRVAQGSAAGKGLLPTLLANLEMARGEFKEEMITSIREHILAVMQAIQPANDGSDVFFSVVRQWTETPAASEEDERPLAPYVPRERGRGGVYLETDSAGGKFSNAPAFPFKRKKSSLYGDDRKRFSSASLRADEVENFTQGKESAIAQLGRLRQLLETLEEDFKEIRKRNVPRARELTTEISAQKNFLQELINDIEFIIKADEPNYVYWSERWGKRGVRVVAAPLDVSALLHEQLYQKKRSIIFASATLSVRDPDAGDAAGLTPYRPLKQVGSGQTAGSRSEGDHEKPHPKSFEFLKNRMGLSLCGPEKLDELLLG